MNNISNYKWRINGTVINSKNDILLYGRRSFCIPKNTIHVQIIIDLITKLEFGITENELNNYTENKTLYKLVEKMKLVGLLTKDCSKYPNTPLEKSYDYFKFFCSNGIDIFEFNTNPRIGIIGCGGVGANVAINLLLSGFTKFFLVDFDNVNNSNLNRQFPYSINDVGQNKAIILKKYMQSYNLNNIDIKCYDFIVNSMQALTNNIVEVADFIVCGIDAPIYQSRRIISQYAIEQGIPVIFGGCGYEQVFIGPLLSTKKALLNHIKYLDEKCSSDYCKTISGSIPSLNTLLTSILTQEILNYFYKITRCESMNRIISLNAFTYEKSELAVFN
jgi:molybdopterin/thiamine biosynthesis adenylyltransferase